MEKIFDLHLVRHGESYNNSVDQSQRVNDPPLTELGQAQALRLAERIRQQFDHSYDNADTDAGSDSGVDSGNKSRSAPLLDKVYTSAFLRTMQTIYPTTQVTNVTPEIWTDLFEVGGCFDGYLPGKTKGMPGMTDAEIAQQFSDYKIPPDIDHTGWWKCKPRETNELAEIRAEKVVQQLHDQYRGTNSTILFVIHGDLIRLLMKIFVPDNPDYFNGVTHNTSMTHLRFAESSSPNASASTTATPEVGNKAASLNNPFQTPQVMLFNDTSHLTPDMISI